MAIRDTEAFIRQQAVLFDPNLDVTPGSPFDTRVIQPLVRRLGVDPFTVDITTFISDRIAQAYPDLANSNDDVITDLLNKPVSILWDPIVRENRRVQRSLSFKDPSTLTLDEADALGANIFSERRKGDFSKGVGRLLFTSPQNVSCSPANFFTSRGGLHFFPISVQSIRTEEMILNTTAEGLYYFDVNLQAEEAGSQYNIGPNELVSVANLPAAVRVQNLRRFRFGQPEETAAAFVGRVRQSLSERSLVTVRGIAAKILNNFPDVSRLNVVGFNDPEMHRDVLRGGGLGSLAAAGTAGVAISDGEGNTFTRRFFTSEVDFLSVISGEPSSWVLTVFGATGPVVAAKDFDIRSVAGSNEVLLENQELILGSSGLAWTLRKRELTLSAIPGGILFPDTANGTVSVPDDEVHIGGAYDVHVRGIDFEEGTLLIENVTDDEPLLSGFEANITASSKVELGDYQLNIDFEEGDAVGAVFESSELFGYTLQILEGVDAGSYRIIRVVQPSGAPVVLTLDPTPTAPSTGPFRWRLFDEINIDLVDPKETRISGNDLRTVQGSDIVDTVSGINLSDYGVAEDDVLRILDGPNAGDYALLADPLAPSFEKIQVDKALSSSGSNFGFTIFRPNTAGGLERPLVRVRSVELLDSSGQPIGSSVPYARPVDVQSRAFQNPARGIKHDLRDAVLGIVTLPQSQWSSVSGQSLTFLIEGSFFVHTFSGAAGTSLATIISELNASIQGWIGAPQVAIQVGSDRIGLRPVRGGITLVGGAAQSSLFGTNSDGLLEPISSFDIRSQDILDEGGFATVEPLIELSSRLDVVQILDGVNAGIYEAPFLVDLAFGFPFLPGESDALVVGPQPNLSSGFAPEVVRRVQIGVRSLGSARVFFLEPTTFEVDPDTRFTLETEEGDLEFLPDPTLLHELLPAAPGGAVPLDGESSDGTTDFSSAGSDFVRSNVQVNDILRIENIPIAGSIVLPDPVPSLVNRTLVFSLDGGPDRTLTFIRDDVSLATHEVSRGSVVDQINAAAGETICQLTGANTLEFETTRTLVIRRTGTANAPDPAALPVAFPGILGDVAGTGGSTSFTTNDQTNESPHAGDYVVADVGPSGVDTLSVTPVFPSASPYAAPLTRQSFRVFRKGLQRITATSMGDNEAEAGLYYFDVELLSLGAGDTYNISANQQMVVREYRSDGYYVDTEDENLAFSPVEPLKLVLSRTILEQGVDDDPANATQLSGQNLQITYDRTPLVEDIQNYIASDIERVVCSSPLGRHLIPVFVRFDFSYTGGSQESVVVPEMEQHILDLYPVDSLESSGLQKIALDRGAVDIDNPIDLIGIVHKPNREIYAVRSQDSITAGRLSAFIPDVLNIVRNTV